MLSAPKFVKVQETNTTNILIDECKNISTPGWKVEKGENNFTLFGFTNRDLELDSNIQQTSRYTIYELERCEDTPKALFDLESVNSNDLTVSGCKQYNTRVRSFGYNYESSQKEFENMCAGGSFWWHNNASKYFRYVTTPGLHQHLSSFFLISSPVNVTVEHAGISRLIKYDGHIYNNSGKEASLALSWFDVYLPPVINGIVKKSGNSKSINFTEPMHLVTTDEGEIVTHPFENLCVFDKGGYIFQNPAGYIIVPPES